MFKKIFSLIIAAALAITSFPVSAFSAIPAPSFTADSVNSYASVTEASFKNSSISVFNIQDLHFNTETQKKIFSLLEKLNISYPGLELYIEGSSENSDFEWVYSSLGKKSGDIFLEALFDSGNISGAEFFAAKYGKKINPVEDKLVFDRNLMLFAELIEQRSEIENLVGPLEADFERLRNKYFTNEQKKIFSTYRKYHNGFMSDADYFDFLKKEAFKSGIDINDYPNIALYILTSGSVVSVSQKKLQAQMSSLFSNLKNILSYKQYSELLALSNNMKDRQALMSYLYQKSEEINLKQYPELNKFIVSIALSDKINRLEFITEENNLSRDLSLKASGDENAKNLFFISRFLDIYKRVLLTSATADDYRYYKDNISKFKNIVAQYVSQDIFTGLAVIEVKAEEFNDTNLRRNEIFISRMLGDSERLSGIYPSSYFGVEANAKAVFENSSKSKVKVIVAGGFHTAGINDILNRKQINNITFMPKIASSGREHSQRYVEYARSLYSAENAAIPLPEFNEISPAELSSRIMDALFKERVNKGFDLSSRAVKEGVEAFMAGRKDIQKAGFFYDSAADSAAVTYTDSAGKENTVYYDGKEDIDGTGTRQSGLTTMLGEFTAETVRQILKSVSFNSIDTALVWMYARILNSGAYDGSGESLKSELIAGTFNFESFFMADKNALRDFVLSLFRYDSVIETDKQSKIVSMISKGLTPLIAGGNVNIIISDNPSLISEDGWCIGAMDVDSDNNVDFYVHTAFLDRLSEMNPNAALMHVHTFIDHERYEHEALYRPESEIYKSFGEFLIRSSIKNIDEESVDNMRTPQNFHLYLESDEFKRVLPGEAPDVVKKQRAQKQLLNLAELTAESYLGKHSPIQYIKKIKSLRSADIDNEMRTDLAFLRLGDRDVTDKYINLLTKRLENMVLPSEKDDYVIAFRKTSPQHIVENIAMEVADKIGLKTVFISQDEYMDTVPLNALRGKTEIRNRLNIGTPNISDTNVLRKEDLSFKKVIVIEDTCKTGVLFHEIARVLNKANVQEVIPLTIFDIREASVSQRKDIKSGRVDESYDVNDYLINYANTNPEKFAQAIISAGGNVSKYVYSALAKMNNNKRYEESFKKILSRFDDATVKTLLDNLISVQSANQTVAALIIPLIYRIYIEKMTTPETKNVEATFVSWIQSEYINGKNIKQKGALTIEKYFMWMDEPFFTVIYAALNGYGKMNLTLKEINYEKEKKLKKTAERLKVSVLEMRESEDIHRQGGIKLEEKEELKKAAQEIKESVAEAKRVFAENIHNNKPDASRIYADTIKSIMEDVENETKRILKEKRDIQISNTEYALVVGGSIVKGSAMPNSDLYYNVISRGKNVAEILNDNFVPFFEFIFMEAGMTPYYSGGFLNVYLGSDGSVVDELSFISQEITDERGIASFLEFEPIDSENVVFKKYLDHYRNRFKSVKGTQKVSRQIRSQLQSIMPQYIGMAKNGEFSRDDISESGRLTFSQYLYAAAKRKVGDNKFESGDYRWYLRAIELLLKDAALKGFEKQILTIDEVRSKQNTGDLIELLAKKDLLGDTDAGKLKRAWSLINIARQKKAASKKEGFWMPINSPLELEAISVLENFILERNETFIKERAFSFDAQENAVFADALSFAQSFDRARHVRAMNRVQQYIDMYGEDTEGRMYAVVLLSDLSQKELAAYEDYPSKFDKREMRRTKKLVIDRIKILQKVVNLPAFDTLASEFSLQNYINMIVTYVSYTDPAVMNAIFADRTQNLLSLYNECNETNYLIKEYEMALDEDRLQLKILENEENKELLKIAISDKEKQVEALKEVLKLQEQQRDAAIKLFYAVYVHIASKLGFNHGFETLRNAPFILNNPEVYSNIINDLRCRLGMEYDSLGDTVKDLSVNLKKHFESKKINIIGQHHRIKSIYSIFEKLKGTRRGSKDPKGRAKLIEKIKKKDALLNDGVLRTEKDFENIAKMIENIEDLMGFHIVVDKKDRDATMAAIEEFFEKPEIKEKGFSLAKAVKYESEADKGFTRYKYNFLFNGDVIGEMVVFSQEQYFNEVFAVTLENATKFPVSHVIYKMGQLVKDSKMYSDKYIEIDVDFSHFSIPKTKEVKALFYNDSIKLQNVVDRKTLEDNMRMVKNGISGVDPLDRTTFIIVKSEDVEGNEVNYIMALPVEATVLDVISSVKFDDKNYVLKGRKNGKDPLDALEVLSINDRIIGYNMETYFLEEVTGEADFSSIESGSAKTVRGKLVELFKGEPVNFDIAPVFIDVDSSGRIVDSFINEKVGLFVKHHGLRNHAELFAAIERKLISEEELEIFLKEQRQYIVEIQTGYLDSEDKTETAFEVLRAKISQIAEASGYSIAIPGEKENQLEPNKDQVGFKVIFNGSEEALQGFREQIKALSMDVRSYLVGDTGTKDVFNYRVDVEIIDEMFDLTKDGNSKLLKIKGRLEKMKSYVGGISSIEETDDGFAVFFRGTLDELNALMKNIEALNLSFKSNEKPNALPLINMIGALGENINAIIENMQFYSASAADLLTALFKSKKSSFADSFKEMRESVLSDLRDNMYSSNAKYGRYEYDIAVSDNPELIASSDSYIFATMDVKDEIIENGEVKTAGRITLYVNEAFLRAIENFDAAEKEFYLRQLALHESSEFLESVKVGANFDYEQYHRNLYSNTDQAKLMEFAAKTAKDEIIKRDRRQLAENAASKLMHSDELTAENPADFVLLCGNDNDKTFEKAVELYRQGRAKEIVIAGGVGRLTGPLIRQAVDKGIAIALSNNTVLTSLADADNFSNQQLEALTTLKEAEIIEKMLIKWDENSERDKSKDIVQGDLKIIKEGVSSNTRENFDNDLVKNIIEEIKRSKDGKPVRAAYIQTPMQQLRTQATFNSVFRNQIENGEIEGVSVTVSDFYKNMDVEDITRQSAEEMIRIIVYSLKGDTLPSINANEFIFDGVIDAGILIQITALLQNSRDQKEIRKKTLELINNTKDSRGDRLFSDKNSIIEALAGKVPQDSYQFEAMKMFLDFVYYDIENGERYKGFVKEVIKYVRILSKLPFIIKQKIIEARNAPQYLKNKNRVFVFDIENAVLNADLIAYMGNFGSKAFAVVQKRYINPNDVLFNLKINTGLRDINIKAALNKVQTEKGTYYELQYSVPFVYETPAADINEEAKAQILSAVFENKEIMQKLKADGLDLSKSSDRLFIETLPDDRTLTTVDAAAQRIAEAAGFTGEARNAERKTEKSGLFNEKLPVAAMLRNDNNADTGIGEITLLRDYAETVLKTAGINGFTMYDLFSLENPYAANYLLLDWTAVPEAKAIVTREELNGNISEQQTVDIEQVARRKILAASKVFAALSAEQMAEVNAYHAANAFWLDAFSSQERAKYSIDIDNGTFVKIMAMQQIFFERQLKDAVVKMADMDLSMYLKGINADNAAGIIAKWISAGITSFTLEIDSVDSAVLDLIADAASKSGFFINVAVKSKNMMPQTAKLISDAGYTPVVAFQDLSAYENVSGYKVEINDKTLETMTSDIEELLKNSAQSGAQSVDYPIGLLWGEHVSENAAEKYRVPAKGSKRFDGINLGLFRLGQKTFEDSYAGNYMNSVETGLNMNISGEIFDINALNTVNINGKSLPAPYAAALTGSLAKQNRLAEIKDFETVILSLIENLGSKENLMAARQYIDRLLSEYNKSQDQQKEINAAKIAGFMQGLSENIIINGREGDYQFSSKQIAKVYANLIAEASLFKSGYYPSSHAGVLPAETLLNKVDDILFRQTLANAKIEIEPMLLNLSVPIQKTGFTFDVFKAGEMIQSKDRAEKAAQVYTALTDYMLDIFIDRVVTRDQIRKSVRVSSMEAVKSIMSAA